MSKYKNRNVSRERERERETDRETFKPAMIIITTTTTIVTEMKGVKQVRTFKKKKLSHDSR